MPGPPACTVHLNAERHTVLAGLRRNGQLAYRPVEVEGKQGKLRLEPLLADPEKPANHWRRAAVAQNNRLSAAATASRWSLGFKRVQWTREELEHRDADYAAQGPEQPVVAWGSDEAQGRTREPGAQSADSAHQHWNKGRRSKRGSEVMRQLCLRKTRLRLLQKESKYGLLGRATVPTLQGALKKAAWKKLSRGVLKCRVAAVKKRRAAVKQNAARARLRAAAFFTPKADGARKRGAKALQEPTTPAPKAQVVRPQGGRGGRGRGRGSGAADGRGRGAASNSAAIAKRKRALRQEHGHPIAEEEIRLDLQHEIIRVAGGVQMDTVAPMLHWHWLSDGHVAVGLAELLSRATDATAAMLSPCEVQALLQHGAQGSAVLEDLAVQKLLIPINDGSTSCSPNRDKGSHWTLLVMQRDGPCRYYDSARRLHPGCKQRAEQVAYAIAQTPVWEGSSQPPRARSNQGAGNQQSDGYSCGLWVLKFAAQVLAVEGSDDVQVVRDNLSWLCSGLFEAQEAAAEARAGVGAVPLLDVEPAEDAAPALLPAAQAHTAAPPALDETA